MVSMPTPPCKSRHHGVRVSQDVRSFKRLRVLAGMGAPPAVVAAPSVSAAETCPRARDPARRSAISPMGPATTRRLCSRMPTEVNIAELGEDVARKGRSVLPRLAELEQRSRTSMRARGSRSLAGSSRINNLGVVEQDRALPVGAACCPCSGWRRSRSSSFFEIGELDDARRPLRDPESRTRRRRTPGTRAP